MSIIVVDFDRAEVDAMLTKLGDGAAGLKRAILEAGAEVVAENMRENVPVNTGSLRDSIIVDDLGDYFAIRTTTGYGLFADQPTEAHDIFPVDAEALRIVLPDGTILFRKHVYHPGTQGTFFVQETVDDSEEDLEDIAVEAIEAFLEDFS